ncbi:MAG: hypothetical protein Q4A42_03055 [Tissierellia bacterium]|nr:hypothetical protein [Tissierellia bacterium]
MVLMIKGNTETYVDELLVGEMIEKGYEIVELEPKQDEKKPEKKEK